MHCHPTQECTEFTTPEAIVSKQIRDGLVHESWSQKLDRLSSAGSWPAPWPVSSLNHELQAICCSWQWQVSDSVAGSNCITHPCPRLAGLAGGWQGPAGHTEVIAVAGLPCQGGAELHKVELS